MELQKSLVLSKKTPESGIARHSSFTHFLDLIDACNFDLKVTSIIPNIEQVSVYKLIFIDVNDYPQNYLFQHPLLSSPFKNRIVLFSVPRDQESIELSALKHGMRGVFYFDDKLENIIKGIQNIKNGKIWFKRKTLETTVQQLLGDVTQQQLKPQHQDCNNSLTKRERTIVELIGQGAKNVEIAERLHISINTVKTHVYSIFRKTECRNRVELIKWSLRQSTVLQE